MDTYGQGPNYVVVQNHGRGSDFVLLRESYALQKAQEHGAYVIELPRLHDACMRKIDQNNTSFWKAIHDKDSSDALGMLERQRVKTWQKNCYDVFDKLPV